MLMIPGLASSAEHTFDLLPDYSLVNALVAKGYDVWLADLRGGCRKAVISTCHACPTVGIFWRVIPASKLAAQAAGTISLHLYKAADSCPAVLMLAGTHYVTNVACSSTQSAEDDSESVSCVSCMHLQETVAARSPACWTGLRGGLWTTICSRTCLLCWSMCSQPQALSKCTGLGTAW